MPGVVKFLEIERTCDGFQAEGKGWNGDLVFRECAVPVQEHETRAGDG